MEDAAFVALLLILVAVIAAGMGLLMSRGTAVRRLVGGLLLTAAVSYVTLVLYYDECGADCGAGQGLLEVAFWGSAAALVICGGVGLVRGFRERNSKRFGGGSSPRG